YVDLRRLALGRGRARVERGARRAARRLRGGPTGRPVRRRRPRRAREDRRAGLRARLRGVHAPARPRDRRRGARGPVLRLRERRAARARDDALRRTRPLLPRPVRHPSRGRRPRHRGRSRPLRLVAAVAGLSRVSGSQESVRPGFLASTLAVARKELVAGLRDRQTTLYTLVLPIVLYPFLFWCMIQGSLFVEGRREHTDVRIGVAAEREGLEPEGLAESLERSRPASGSDDAT